MAVAQNDVIKIKQEKFDPEIEQKINATLLDAKPTHSDHEERKPIIEPNGSVLSTECIEVEQRGENSNEDSEDSDATDAEAEDKKSIEPVKSSNEILTELFKVFNAAPPEELLNDENLLKKKKEKKQHKKERKKKKKKSKSDIKQDPGDKEEGSDTSVATSGDCVGHLDKKAKHKKHKKHKRKSEKSKDKSKNKLKDKEKSKSREKEKSRERDKNKESEGKVNTLIKEEPTERARTESERSSSKSRKRTAVDTVDATEAKRKRSLISFTLQSTSSRPTERSRERDKGHNSFYNGYKESISDHRSTRNERKSLNYSLKESKIKKEPEDIRTESTNRKNRSRVDGHISEISLSDEETYLKERINVNHRRNENNSTSSSSRYKTRNAFYDGVDRQNSREDRSRHHSYRQSSRSRDLGIDKKRLLEIARKNAISMFKRGNLPGCADMSEEVKDKVLLKMRYGGRTVQDLTEFCKKLSNGENLNDISDLSSDEDSDVDKHGNAKAFNHPFMIKEREPIVMHIRGSAPISSIRKGEDLAKAITLQFPVSSGQQHRLTEAWKPVENKEPLAPLPALPAASQSTSIFKAAKPEVRKNVFENPVPKHTEQEPAFKVTNVDASSAVSTLPTDEQVAAPLSNALATLPTPVPPVGVAPTVPTPFVPDVPIPSAAPSSETVFPKNTAPSLDVSSIISKRLNAMRRLQENPMDSEALKMMYNSQKEMTSWASSKHVPGQFTGSTGANILTAKELSSGPQVWARRDQLTSTQPMTGGMGMQLLKKMGWKPGEGLGREKTGSLQPLLLDVKLDKRGLVSEEDNAQKRQQMSKKRRNVSLAEAQQSLQEKHPVSLLNELTSKRKWTPPLYTLVSEGGPSHSKSFMFSVSINGQAFVPDEGSNTKKDAKVIAARHCLQQIGIIP